MRARIAAAAALAGGLGVTVFTVAAPAERCAGPQRARNCSSRDLRPRPDRGQYRRTRALATLGVREHEYRVALSRPDVWAGSVVVELDNRGKQVHDLRIARTGSEQPLASFSQLQPGSRATKAVILRPGSYQLWCTLPGHRAAGMYAVLRVK